MPIVESPKRPGLLFTAAAATPPPGWRPSANCAIYRTMDGGDHWERLTEGLPEQFDIMVRQMAVTQDSVYLAAGSKLYVSRDEGDSWEVLVDDLPHIRALALR